MPRLRARTIPVADLTESQRAQMWSVFQPCYAFVDEHTFRSDLDDKHHVFLLFDGADIRGFSTVRIDVAQRGTERVVSIFSGDTVIHRDYRGQTALQWAFFRYILHTKAMNPRSVVVWFLISKGYKTYLLLSRNFVTFYPRRDRESPKWAKELLLELAERRYPGVVDPDSLVLAFGERAGRLRANVAPTAQQADPDIRFFERANPGHGRGDELCCLGVIEGKLLVAWPIKRLGRASRGWRRRAPRGSASTERDQSQSHP